MGDFTFCIVCTRAFSSCSTIFWLEVVLEAYVDLRIQTDAAAAELAQVGWVPTSACLGHNLRRHAIFTHTYMSLFKWRFSYILKVVSADFFCYGLHMKPWEERCSKKTLMAGFLCDPSFSNVQLCLIENNLDHHNLHQPEPRIRFFRFQK